MIQIAQPFFGEEEEKAVCAVLRSGMLVNGPFTREFEERIACLVGRKYCIALSSGTAALHTALHAAGISSGSEVITSPFSFIATANAILFCNGKPIFVDIEQENYTIDYKLIESKITPQTKAIVTVDLFGQSCDYTEIEALAKKHNLLLITDSCQSLGAKQNSKCVGSFGELGVFSLYATKNITCGEGGLLVTDDEQIEKRAREFYNQGQEIGKKYSYTDLGLNYRMTEMQAAIALEQVKKIDWINKKRRANAELLSQLLSKIKNIHLPAEKDGNTHVFHQYTIRVNSQIRDTLVTYLQEKGIEASIFYPKPLHLYSHLKKIGYVKGDFPVAEKVSQEVISLPIHPLVSDNDIIYIATCIREFYEKM